MKIFIGSSETGGIINLLTKVLKEQNHEVTSVSYPYAFMNYSYDFHPQKFLIQKFSNYLLKSFLNILNNHFFRLYRKLSEFYKKQYLKNFDLYIYVWAPFLETDEILLKFLKKNNTKVITLFLGSEVRNYQTFLETYNLRDIWVFPEHILNDNNDTKLKKLRLHERYSDVIFSVPDQAIEAKRPYYHIFLPIPINELKFNPKARKIPLIIHAPTDPYKKGTDFIIRSINELRKEGLQFHFINIKNLPKEKLLKLLSISDILVDEIVLHGPGFMSIEAMALGCMSMTKHFAGSPPEFQPPLISIDHTNIKEKLKYYILNSEERVEIILKARKYVEEHNSPEKVIDYYFNCLNNQIKPQYEI
jgi:glycosyltransferase involved in cell wall biosynthesis